MKTTNNQTNNVIESLQNLVANLQQQLAEKDEKIQSLNHQLHLFRTARFGRKSEKFVNDKQLAKMTREKSKPQRKPSPTPAPRAKQAEKHFLKTYPMLSRFMT